MSEAMSRGITAEVYWSSSGWAHQSRCLHTCYYSDEGQRPEVEDGKPNHRFCLKILCERVGELNSLLGAYVA